MSLRLWLQVFYVWFDAPIGYLGATREWADDRFPPERAGAEFDRWWRTDRGAEDVTYTQFMGKDNVPFHTVIFPSSLIGERVGVAGSAAALATTAMVTVCGDVHAVVPRHWQAVDIAEHAVDDGVPDVRGRQVLQEPWSGCLWRPRDVVWHPQRGERSALYPSTCASTGVPTRVPTPTARAVRCGDTTSLPCDLRRRTQTSTSARSQVPGWWWWCA